MRRTSSRGLRPAPRMEGHVRAIPEPWCHVVAVQLRRHGDIVLEPPVDELLARHAGSHHPGQARPGGFEDRDRGCPFGRRVPIEVSQDGSRPDVVLERRTEFSARPLLSAGDDRNAGAAGTSGWSAAAARALRRQPAKVGVEPVASDRVAPFGDGRTMRRPSGRVRTEPGESEQRPSPRGEARRASRDPAYSAAVSSFHRYGNTAAPLAAATTTAVEKVRTSTMTMTTASLTGASISTPRGPHSKRRSNSDWSGVMWVDYEPNSDSLNTMAVTDLLRRRLATSRSRRRNGRLVRGPSQLAPTTGSRQPVQRSRPRRA